MKTLLTKLKIGEKVESAKRSRADFLVHKFLKFKEPNLIGWGSFNCFSVSNWRLRAEVYRSGFHGSFRRDLGSAQAISRDCTSAFVINVHILPNTFSPGSETQANKIIERFIQLQENYILQNWRLRAEVYRTGFHGSF